MYIHWRKSNNERKGKPKQNFDAAFGTILRIIFYFSLEEGIYACTESTDLIL
jgi:hypothetical protein